MASVSGYRRVSLQGTSLCVFVTTLLKDSGIEAGDVVRVTIESARDGEDEGDAGSD